MRPDRPESDERSREQIRPSNWRPESRWIAWWENITARESSRPAFGDFRAQCELEYHTHPVSESITVLSGTAMVAVEGREYSLGLLDTIVIPRGVAHAAWNTSATARGVVHVALASEAPARELGFHAVRASRDAE